MEKINEYFKIPISFNKQKMELNSNIIEDLELIKTIDSNQEQEQNREQNQEQNREQSTTSIYEYTYNPKTSVGKKVLEQYPTHYTTDIQYLKDTQNLLKLYKPYTKQSDPISDFDHERDLDHIVKIWEEIKNDSGFKNKYQYIDWSFWEFINKSETLLQFLCLYNLASPVLSFLTPILILITPFFIIQSRGVKLDISQYIEILKVVSSNNPIGKFFTRINDVTLNDKIYLLVSTAFYVFSIYQNILTCIRFNANMKKIHNYFDKLKNYIRHTKAAASNLLTYTIGLKSYETFTTIVENKILILSRFLNKLENITPYKCCIFDVNYLINKTKQFGKIMKYFYDIYSDEALHECFLYSFGFNGYLENLEGLIDNINNNHIHLASFNKSGKEKRENKKKDDKKKDDKNDDKNDTRKDKSYFKNSYYPALINKNPVKNTIQLNNNIIITGPNASGKTTILKTTLINIILTQQIGCGFYEKAKLSPFKFIHCYLNIPDTSGRDSLFQAEARRCKNIIDIIQENAKDSHFCAFDELYSGTNPTEAVSSASAFMNYLITFKSVNCMLTTHFIELCKDLEKTKSFENCHMETKMIGTEDNDFNYTYLLKKNISFISGGIKVLKDMNYPTEIITNSLSRKN